MITAGPTASATCGTCISSTSSAASPASRSAASAATRPASILAPSLLVATGPIVVSAAATIRVVVDLPLVPVMIAVRRPTPSCPRIERSRVIATRPPIIAPAPRPVTREAQRADEPSANAARPRIVIVGLGMAGEFMPTAVLFRLGLYSDWATVDPTRIRCAGRCRGCVPS